VKKLKRVMKKHLKTKLKNNFMFDKILSVLNFKKEPLSEGSSLYQNEGKDMWLIVGLGNPGKDYEKHRHNVGFMVIDAIADDNPSFPAFRSKYKGSMTEGAIAGSKVILLKPETFMNLSGESVVKVSQFYKTPPEKIIVFHDELDLNPGEVRVKLGGGNAGHNGLKSIQQHLGTPDFWRVRIGIGRPQHKGQVSSYVLSNFDKEDQNWLSDLLEKLSRSISIIIRENPDAYAELFK